MRPCAFSRRARSLNTAEKGREFPWQANFSPFAKDGRGGASYEPALHGPQKARKIQPFAA
jgi:hypothetical protein